MDLLDPMSQDMHSFGLNAQLSYFSDSASHIWVLTSLSSFRPTSSSCAFILRLELCLTLIYKDGEA